jgi:hypothetical protein
MNHLKIYLSLLSELDRLLSYSEGIVEKLDGISSSNEEQRTARIIFKKQITHVKSLQRLLPLGIAENDVWDLASTCALARCVIESFDAFVYFCLGDLTPEERSFRQLVANFHDLERRAAMLKLIDSTDISTLRIENETLDVRREVETHPLMTTDMRKRFSKGVPPQYLITHDERNRSAGLSLEQYKVSTMYLSQHVHTTPISINQLALFKAGGADELHMMGMPMRYCLPYFAMGIQAIVKIFPESAPALHSDIEKSLDGWCHIAKNGLRSIPVGGENPQTE